MKLTVFTTLLPFVSAIPWPSSRRSDAATPLTGQVNIVVNSTYTIGPLSSSLNSFGEYSSGSSALTVNAMVPNDGSTFEIAVADAPYPCLGAAVGFASTSNDLLPGSANYVVLTPVASVPSGMASVAGSAFADAANAMGANVTSTVTSALWKLDASTGTLIPTWKNSDGSNAVATFVYDWDAEAMLLVGNLSMFIATMNANVTNITLQISSM